MGVGINKLDLADISGHKKASTSLLRPWQDKYIYPVTNWVPKWLQTNHLTLMTIGWSILVLVGGYLGKFNKIWLIWAVIAIIGHYLTDFLDGEIGRRRKTGLVLWGFLVDHYLDFVFGCATGIAAGLMADINPYLTMAGLVIISGTFLLELHECNLFGKYEVYGHDGIGGIELEMATAIYFLLGMVVGKSILQIMFYCVLLMYLVQMVKHFCRLQKKVWEIDMENKKNPKKN